MKMPTILLGISFTTVESCMTWTLKGSSRSREKNFNDLVMLKSSFTPLQDNPHPEVGSPHKSDSTQLEEHMLSSYLASAPPNQHPRHTSIDSGKSGTPPMWYHFVTVLIESLTIFILDGSTVHRSEFYSDKPGLSRLLSMFD